MGKEIRDKVIKIRFTEAELEQVRHICPRAEVARWFREMALNPTDDWVRNEEVKASDPALLRALSGIGNNINQIARAVNERAPSEQVDLLVELQGIRDQLNALKS